MWLHDVLESRIKSLSDVLVIKMTLELLFFFQSSNHHVTPLLVIRHKMAPREINISGILRRRFFFLINLNYKNLKYMHLCEKVTLLKPKLST